MPRMRSVETVIVGAGQAGLIVSKLLSEAGREHVLLERRGALGGAWQDRWDDFCLVSPNWTTSIGGFAYRGPAPDGYMPRDEIVDHFRAFAAAIRAPVELATDVTGLQRTADGPARFRLETSTGRVEARTVVVAGGPFQAPHVPAMASSLDPAIDQLHIQHYRNPRQLAPGGVLIVGSGQSGVQLAEELMAGGRAVSMAVGRCGRVPRRYRGRDIFWWLRQLATRGPEVGVGLPNAGTLPDPRLRFACNPQASGHGDPHDTNLRAMARDGLRLFGRLETIDGGRVRFADDLAANLRFADAFFQDRLKGFCDAFAARSGEELPADEPAQVPFEPDTVAEIDLPTEGISTVLWTSGYRPAFGWVHADVLDDMGLPRQVRGLTSVPGLAFIGTPWLVDMGSANLVGLERDATSLVERLLADG